jgi:hypothetical protein
VSDGAVTRAHDHLREIQFGHGSVEDSGMKIRTRFWLESAIASVAALLAVATLIVPDWIETVFSVDPDGGNGVVEWGITAAFAILAIVFALAARLEYRHTVLSSRALASMKDS